MDSYFEEDNPEGRVEEVYHGLRQELINIQKRTFTKWMNSHLSKADMQVQDLFTDLSDGTKLMKLLEIISGDKIGKPNRGKMRVHKLDNVNKCLTYLHTKVRLVNIGARDIVDGNESLILGLVWSVIHTFHIVEIEKSAHIGDTKYDGLFGWCKVKTTGYPGVNIENFTTSWQDGLGFNALIHSHFPELIDFESLDPLDPPHNLDNAFTVAEHDLGVPRLLEVEDVMFRAEERSIKTYLATCYSKIREILDKARERRKITWVVKQLKEADDLKTEQEKLTSDILDWINDKISELESQEFPNTIDGIIHALTKFKEYRTVEKPPKYNERIQIEASVFAIQSQLKELGIPTHLLPETALVHDIAKAWDNLEHAENNHEKVLKEQLFLREKQENLAYKFDKKSALCEGYLKEMIQVLSDPLYGSNLDKIEATVKKHETLSTDIFIREERFEDLSKIANELLKGNYREKKRVKKREKEIMEQWNYLIELVKMHDAALQKSNKLMNLLREIDTVISEISDMKKGMETDDCGQHLQSVEYLLEKHNLMEAHITSQGKTIEKLIKQSLPFLDSSLENKSKTLQENLEKLNKEYEDLIKIAQQRRAKLEEGQAYYQFIEDYEEEMAWLDDNHRICSAVVEIQTLRAVLSLQHKHQSLKMDTMSRKKRIQKILQDGKKLIKNKHPQKDVSQKMNELQTRWESLQELLDVKSKQLEVMSEAFQYHADANEAESWIKEKLLLVSSEDYGIDEPSAQALLKLHKQLKTVIQTYSSEIETLDNEAKRIIDKMASSKEFALLENQSEEEEWIEVKELVPVEEYVEKVVEKEIMKDVIVKRKIPRVRARFSFSGEEDFVIKQGEVMNLLAKTNEDWWEVLKSDGQQGFAPATYVEEIEPKIIHKSIKKPVKVPEKKQMLEPVMKEKIVRKKKEKQGKTKASQVNTKWLEDIRQRQDSINKVYQELIDKCQYRLMQLTVSVQLLSFYGEVNDLLMWMKEKEESLVASLSTKEDFENKKKTFVDFLSTLSVNRKRVKDIDKRVKELTNVQPNQLKEVKACQKQVHDRWDMLNNLKLKIENELKGDAGVELFNQTYEDVCDWMQEKLDALHIPYVGKDMKNIEALQRQHQQLEKELVPLEEKLGQVNALAKSAKTTSPQEAKAINGKQEKLRKLWEKVKAKISENKVNLDQSYGLQIFRNDSNRLLHWIDTVKEELREDENASGLNAEELLKKNHDLCDDIKAHDEDFTKVQDLGQALLKQPEHAKEVFDRLSELQKEQQIIYQGWQEKEDYLGECQELQLFLREAEQIDRNTNSHNKFLEFNDLGPSVYEAESLLRHHQDFIRTLSAQDEKLKAFNKMAEKLIANDHFESENIDVRRRKVISARQAVKEKAFQREKLLLASLSYQKFLAAVDELSVWIQEKLKIALDESYWDLTNLKKKLQKHESLEAELKENETELKKINKDGNSLIGEKHYFAEEIAIALDNLNSDWEELCAQMETKGRRLKQALTQQTYNEILEDVMKKLKDIEASLSVEDYGSDLRNVKDLLLQQKHLENEMFVLSNKVEEIVTLGEEMASEGHFDAANILKATETVSEKLDSLKTPASKRRRLLEDSLKFYEFSFDVELEEQWIREHLPAASLEVAAENLTDANNMYKSHKKLESEIEGHEALIQNILLNGQDIIKQKHFASEEVKQKCKHLRKYWNNLLNSCSERSKKLELSVKVHQFLADANDIEAWISEKNSMLAADDYGKDEDSAVKLLTKHRAVELEIETYMGLIKEIDSQAQALVSNDHPDAKLIGNKLDLIEQKTKNLQKLASERRQKLIDTKHYHEYIRESGDLMKWIEEQMRIATSEEYGDDYEYFLILQKKFEEFKRHSIQIGTQRFNQCEELAKQLISTETHFATEFESSQQDLGAAWESFLEYVNAREQKLAAAGDIHRFNRDVAEILTSIHEYYSMLSDDNLGKDIYSVRSMMLHHEVLQNNILALEGRVQVLLDDSETLQATYPGGNSEHILQQQQIVIENWNVLQEQMNTRKEKLEASYNLQSLYGVMKDLEIWSIELCTLMSRKEPINDIATVQFLLGEHQNLRAEIDVREENFQTASQAAEEMVEDGHYAVLEIKERLTHLMDLKEQLEDAWYDRKSYLDQSLDLLSFLRDSKQLETINAQQKVYLETPDDSVTVEEVNKLVKKHEAFEKILANQDEMLLNPLQEKAKLLIDQNHMNSELIKKTIDEVCENRNKVKEMSHARNLRLTDSLLYLKFKRQVGEESVWINERKMQLEAEMANANDIAIEEKVKKLKKHETFTAELTSKENDIVNIKENGEILINKSHDAKLEIKKQLQNLLDEWNELIKASNLLSRILQEAQDILEFLNEVEKIEIWIRDKEAMVLVGDTGNDYEHCLSLQHKLADVDSDMRVDESRMVSMNELADRLISERRSGFDSIQERRKNVNDRWKSLQVSLDKYREQLNEAFEIHTFHRDMDEINDRINEKYLLLTNSEEAKDLLDVERLQHKQNDIEKDMMIIRNQLKDQTKKIQNLTQKSPAEANDIKMKYIKVQENWERLVDISNKRKEQLSHSHNLQKFLFDLRELELWVNEMIERMSSEELPSNIPESENMMQEHQEKKAEIDGRQESVQELKEFGHKILQQNADAKGVVEESLQFLEELRLTLLQTWEENKEILSQNYQLQVFKEHANQVESWLLTKEAFLNNDDLGNSTSSTEALIRKHEHFEKNWNAQTDKVINLEKMVTELVANKHYESSLIQERFKEIVHRKRRLEENIVVRRKKLNEAKELQLFLRNISEVVGWINDKIQVASDESYRDLSNLLSKIQKHATFEAEISANKPQIDSVTSDGEKLIGSGHYASMDIQTQLQKLEELWVKLLDQATLKRERLHEAYKALQFNRILEDLETWINDVENQLQTDDHGKDLASVKKFIKKHQALEADINCHSENVREAREMASQFLNEHHFMEEEIFERITIVVNRFQALDEPAQIRRENLENVLLLEQFKHDVNEELSWMIQKVSLVTSTDFGNSVSAVKALQKKQQLLEADIHNREQLITSIVSKGMEMVRSKHFASTEVKDLLQKLQNQFQELKDLAKERRLQLKYAESLQAFYADAYEHEAFLEEKQLLLNSSNLGEDEDAVETFLKTLDTVDQDLEQFEATISQLSGIGQDLAEEKESEKENIEKRIEEIETLHRKLCKLAEERREKLNGRKSYIIFMQDADELIAWIKDQITVASSDDCGTDVEHVVVLIQKFENFVTSLKAKDDQIAAVKEYAKMLVAQNHLETETIKAKNAEILQLWEELQETIASRLEALEGAKLVHTFDRSADETISWIQEKVALLSKEDYGHDLDTIQAQIKNHEMFQCNLAAVKEQVDSLATEADKLGTTFPEAKKHIQVTQNDVNKAWLLLLQKSAERETKLKQAEKLQVYFNEYQELFAWINEMMARITSEELANSVDGAEALLARHAELKSEIDTQKETITRFQQSGQAIINEGHFLSSNIEQQLKELDASFKKLLQTWDERKLLYVQNLDLQKFKRDAEKLENWLKKNEPLLKTNELGNSIQEVDRLIQKHEDFMKALKAQDENMQALQRTTLLEEAFQKQKQIEEQRKKEEEQRRERLRREAIQREGQNKHKQDKEDKGKTNQGAKGKSKGGAFERSESRRLSMRPTHSRHKGESDRWTKTEKDLNKIDIEGYLQRKQELTLDGKKAPVRKWKTLYTVLFRYMLCFFKDKEAFINNVNAEPPVLLTGVQITEARDYIKKKNAFRITFKDGSQMLFTAYSKDLMDVWINKLKYRSRPLEDSNSSATSTMERRSTEEANSSSSVDEVVLRKNHESQVIEPSTSKVSTSKNGPSVKMSRNDKSKSVIKDKNKSSKDKKRHSTKM